MDLGQFSISLAVKNMDASLDFYQNLGFEIIDGGHLNEGFRFGKFLVENLEIRKRCCRTI